MTDQTRRTYRVKTEDGRRRVFRPSWGTAYLAHRHGSYRGMLAAVEAIRQKREEMTGMRWHAYPGRVRVIMLPVIDDSVPEASGDLRGLPPSWHEIGATAMALAEENGLTLKETIGRIRRMAREGKVKVLNGNGGVPLTVKVKEE